MATILVATTKPWNIKAFAELKGSDPDWHLITSKEALNSEYLSRLAPDWIFFPHWSWIVDQDIYEQWNCVVFHTAPLPKYRGGSVFQHQIMDGHRFSEICAVKMVGELDAGPIYKRVDIALDGSMDEIFEWFSLTVYPMMEWIIEGDYTLVPQKGEPTVYRRRTPDMSLLPENGTRRQIYNFIRALDAPGYPKAFLDYGEFHMEFDQAELVGERLTARVRITKR